MSLSSRFLWVLTPLLCGSAALFAAEREPRDAARRGVFEPGLMLDAGGRTAACDVIHFTQDGSSLLACGDDKVVRMWPCDTNGLKAEGERLLRWGVYRESRGNIYTLALSHDREQHLVAFAGSGLRGGDVVVLDRLSGQMVHTLTAQTIPDGNTIWAMAFSPDDRYLAYGTQLGDIFLWDLSQRGQKPIRLGKAPSPAGRPLNFVRLVTFLNERSLLTVAQDGEVLEWNITQPAETPKKRFRFEKLGRIRCVIWHPEKRWLAAGGEGNADETHFVEVRSLEGQPIDRFDLGERHFPRCLAFDPAGATLAMGYYQQPDAEFYKLTGGGILLADLRRAGQNLVRQGPSIQFFPEALAFHPDGLRLAVADGNDFEVELWQLQPTPQLTSVIRSAGQCLWGVALSEDGQRLGYQTGRAASPDHPNRLGTGEWNFFDLKRRRFLPPQDDFKDRVLARDRLPDWSVLFDDGQKPRNPTIWRAKHRSGKAFVLPLEARDGQPRCYTFLQAEPAKGDQPARPERLVIGHYWGLSVFALDPKDGPRLMRKFSGHQGEVLAVAPSRDQTLLVSASRDQTLACWSLLDWSTNPELGATFRERLGQLEVDKVSTGSPLWQAGLSPGDVVKFFLAARGTSLDLLYDGASMREKRAELKQLAGRPSANLAAALKYLNPPENKADATKHVAPGTDISIFWQRPDQAKTPPEEWSGERFRVLQRPMWCFFPTREREWILWRWHDYIYDTSTHGDRMIGWQVSYVDRKAEFHQAFKFKTRFHRPELIARSLLETRVNPQAVRIPELLPPELTIGSDRTLVDANATIQVQLRIAPRSEQGILQPQRVYLWLDDFRYWESTNPKKDMQFDRDQGVYTQTMTIRAQDLRSGANRLILQCYTPAGTSDFKSMEVVKQVPAPVRPRLFVHLIGVEKYGKVNARNGFGENLRFLDLPGCVGDVHTLEQMLLGQKRYFQGEPVMAIRMDAEATRENILGDLQATAKQAGPDDVLIFFLSGHGLSMQYLDLGNAKVVSDAFTFVGPEFDINRPAETALTARALYDELIHLRCRKLILLNTCHSGAVVNNPVREFTVDGIGPVLLSACKPEEEAFTHPDFGGLFTRVIEEAFGRQFATVAQDDKLDTLSLASFAERRVPQLVKEWKDKKLIGQEYQDRTQTLDYYSPQTLRQTNFVLVQRK